MRSRFLLTLSLLALLSGLPTPAAAQGAAPGGTVIFPTDTLTVADAAQLTGRRMNLPAPDCTVLVSRCAEVELVNELDGFDLLPQIVVQLDNAPTGSLDEVFTADVLGVRPASGGDTVGVTRLVYDPTTRRLFGEPADQLREATVYEVIFNGMATSFTTMTASAGLVQMREQLDDGSAYTAAGIPEGDRGLSFSQGEQSTVFPAPQVVTMTRYDETTPGGALTAETILNTAVAGAGSYGFGSYASPSWLNPDRTISPAPTGGDGPTPTGFERVGVTLILPQGSPPAGGWPVAIFGPGITRSKYDIFLAADANAAAGIATLSLDPVGHAFGAGSEVGVQLNTSPDEVRFSGFGRGIDLNSDGTITNQEGVQSLLAPHRKSSVGLRDGLRQTAADLSALVRAIRGGGDIDGDGTPDLSTEEISVYAQSLGGIYSTMAVGADPMIEVAVLNVPGGAILDIARVSPVFRDVVADLVRDRIPGLLNGGIDGITEDLPLLGEPSVESPVDGAVALQELLYTANWIARPGSPEAFAPLMRSEPFPSTDGQQQILFQFALGDETVTNPSSFRLARAFGDDTRVALYRNDLTLTAMSNPHGFLLDPTIQGRNQGQAQVVDFISSRGATLTDPDGPLPTWEVPIIDRDILLARNFPASAYAAASPRPARQATRVAGEATTPAETAAAVSGAVYDEAATVVIGRDDDYADSLAGGPLARTVGGPLLLTTRDGLSAATAAEVARLGAETAILLGGEAALSTQVATDLEAAGLTVERIGGANRFATAALVAERIGYRSEVLLVEGENADPARGWPDALSAAGIGAGLGQPILLTNASRLPTETSDALLASQDVTIIGGTAAVSAAVEAMVAPLVNDVARVAGANRFETSTLAAREAILRGLSPQDVWLATGSTFVDGLLAGSAAGVQGGLFLLVDGVSLDRSPAVGQLLLDHGASIDMARVVGTGGSVSAATEMGVRAAIG